MPAIKKLLPKAHEQVKQVVGKVKAGLPDVLPKLPPALMLDDGPRARGGLPDPAIEAALRPLRRTRLAGHRRFATLDRCLTDYGRRGGTLADFQQELADHALDVLRRHRRLLDTAEEIAGLLQRRTTLLRFRDEVVLPACRRQIGGDVAWARTRDITGRDVRQMGREAGPNCSFGLGINVELAAVVSMQGGRGIAALLWKNRGWYEWVAVGLGCHVEGEFTGVASFQVGPPTAGESLTVNAGIGGAYGLSVNISAAFVLLEDQPIEEWPLDGIEVSVGGGYGVEISAAAQLSYYHPFAG